MLDEVSVEDGRVEDDDELFEVLTEDDARVEPVSEEQTEHFVGESQQDVETVGVVGSVVQPATERAEQQRYGVVAERVDHVRISSVTTQHANTRLHLHSTAHAALSLTGTALSRHADPPTPAQLTNQQLFRQF